MKKILVILFAISFVCCNKKKDEDPKPEPVPGRVHLSRTTAFFKARYNVYAIDADSGTIIWKQPTHIESISNSLAWGYSTPTYSDGILFTGSSTGYMSAFDAVNGTLKWDFNCNAAIVSAPTVKFGNLYFGNYAGDIYALDVKTATPTWAIYGNRRSLIDQLTSAPTVKDSILYMGNRVYSVNALDPLTGKEKWGFGLGAYSFYRPTVSNGAIYLKDAANVYAINASNGSLKWSVRKVFTPWGYTSPTLAGGTLYVTDPINLYALDTAKGTEKWEFGTDLGYRVFTTSPIVWNNLVIIGSSTDMNETTRPSYVDAIDTATGNLVWKYTGTNNYYVSPTIYNGNLYIASVAGLEVIDLATGKLKWKFSPDADDFIRSGICIVDTHNHLFTSSNSGDHD